MSTFLSPEGRFDGSEIEATLNGLSLPELKSLLDSVRLKISSAEIDLNPTQSLGILETRFFGPQGHDRQVDWRRIENSFLANVSYLQALNYLERGGGMPNVIKYDYTGFWVADCAKEVPASRIYLAYDESAAEWWEKESQNWWKGIQERNGTQEAMHMICLGSAISRETRSLGLELMDPELYQYFQSLGQFDRRMATWLKTPPGQKPLIGYRSASSDKVMIASNYPHATSSRLGARYVTYVPWAV